MAELIKSIKDAPDAASAGRDYAEAMKIDGKNTELCEAYMRRMWHFEKYRIAYYPALQLTKKDPTNGLAWGIVGYYQAMRGNYLKALEPTLQAAKCMPDDAATMSNAGSLVTWYDRSKPQPKISPELKSLIELGKLSWAGTKEFSEGCASYAKKVGDMKKKADKLAGEISEKKKRIGSLAGEYKKLDGECRKKYKEAVDAGNHRKNLRNQLAEVERKRPADLRKKRNEFKKKIDEAGKRFSGLRKQWNDLQSKAPKIRRDIDAAKKAIRKLEAQSGGTRPKFDFRRPGGDGKITAAAPKGKPKAKDKGKKN
ncbi:MAG: hypothetical protein KAX78_12770 [Phycisphaerae bacterium]|nr:hypothetical protein [Phycisphaerae bacterium]